MPNKQIKQFTAATVPLTGSELVPISQLGFTRQVPLSGLLISGLIGSGLISSGSVQGFFGNTRNIASGTVGSFDFGSGAVTAGTVGSGAVQSGNISSGVVQGFFGTGRHIVSGTIGSADFGSGAVLSGHIASGQVPTFALQSGIAINNLAATVTGPGTAGGDWIFNQTNAGNDIVLEIGGTEQGRWSHGSNFQVVFGLRVRNGANFAGDNRSSTLGGSNLNDFNNGKGLNNRWTASAAINVTGMVAGADGEVRFIWNVGANSITLTNQDASSAAANQWLTTKGVNIILDTNKCVLAVYDNTTGAWRASLLP